MTLATTDTQHSGIRPEVMPPVAPPRNPNAPLSYATLDPALARKRNKAVRDAQGHFRSKHDTVTTSRDITVDRGIADLIEALWTIGFETQFSCEGNADLFDPSGSLENHTDAAHIIFPDVEQGVKFAELSYRFLIHARPDLPWAGLMTVEMGLPLKTVEMGTIRSVVRFNPDALESLTKYWKTSLNASH